MPFAEIVMYAVSAVCVVISVRIIRDIIRMDKETKRTLKQIDLIDVVGDRSLHDYKKYLRLGVPHQEVPDKFQHYYNILKKNT
jgi:hypothetical protein